MHLLHGYPMAVSHTCIKQRSDFKLPTVLVKFLRLLYGKLSNLIRLNHKLTFKIYNVLQFFIVPIIVVRWLTLKVLFGKYMVRVPDGKWTSLLKFLVIFPGFSYKCWIYAFKQARSDDSKPLFISLISILASALIFQMERSLINLETILFSRL
jgi:hypothetical protein